MVLVNRLTAMVQCIMRSIMLLVFAMGLQAAEPTKTPKPTPITPRPLGTAERLALGDLTAKRADIDKSITTILKEVCSDRQIPEDKCKLNNDGTFTPYVVETKK